MPSNSRQQARKRPRQVLHLDDIRTIAPPERLSNSSTTRRTALAASRSFSTFGVRPNSFPELEAAIERQKTRGCLDTKNEPSQQCQTENEGILTTASGMDDDSTSSNIFNFDGIEREGLLDDEGLEEALLMKKLKEAIDLAAQNEIIEARKGKEEEERLMGYWDERILMLELLENIGTPVSIVGEEMGAGTSRQIEENSLSDGSLPVESDTVETPTLGKQNNNIAFLPDSEGNKTNGFQSKDTSRVQNVGTVNEGNDSQTAECQNAHATETETEKTSTSAVIEPRNHAISSSSLATEDPISVSHDDSRNSQGGLQDNDLRTANATTNEPVAGTDLNKNDSGSSYSISTIRHAIPKWIPSNHFDSDVEQNSQSGRLLFTVKDFDCIIESVRNQISEKNRADPKTVFKVVLHDDHPECSKDHYLLEASASNNHNGLYHLRKTTETFVRSKISAVNLKRLLDDDASLVLDVPLNIHQPIGIQISSFAVMKPHQKMSGNIHEGEVREAGSESKHPHSQGIWIRSVLPTGSLAKIFGGHQFFEAGAAVLATGKENTPLGNARQLKKILDDAKANRDVDLIFLTLCVSKYSIPRISDALLRSKFNIRRRDGAPYNPMDYADFRQPKGPARKCDTIATFSMPHSAQNKPEKECDPPTNPTANQTTSSIADLNDTRKTDDEPQKNSPPLDAQSQNVASDNESGKQSIPSEVVFPTDGNDDSTILDDSTSQGGEKSVATEKKTPEKSPRHRFLQFQAKYKSFVELDFKEAKIFAKPACFSMWAQHKKHIGFSCNHDCVCHKQLSCTFAVNVIKDHIHRMKERYENLETDDDTPDWEATEEDVRNRTGGIFLYFIPKFMSKLVAEYPEETGAQLLTRLAHMWHVHQHTRMPDGMFGLRCKRDCRCDEYWNTVFNRGDPKMEDIRYEKESAVLSSRKANRSTQSLLGNSIQRPFEVVFDTGKPLGGYFLTNKVQVGCVTESKCTLYSKCPTGQMAKDRRFMVGTYVMAIMVGERRHRVCDHSSLHKYYVEAKRNRNKLRVIFQNSCTCKQEPPEVARRNWDTGSVWRGKITSGWSGESSYEGRTRQPSAVAHSGRVMQNSDSGHRNYHHHHRYHSHHHHNERSRIPRASVNKPCAVNVENRPNTTIEQEVARRNCDAVFLPSGQVIDVIQNGRCEDLIEMLEDGPDFGRAFVTDVLQAQHDYLGNNLEKMKGSGNRESDVLESKRKILKLYINSAHFIEKAMGLRSWSTISIELKCLELSAKGEAHHGDMVNIIVRTKSPNVELGRLRSHRRSPRITGPRNAFVTHNNCIMSLENRRLEVEISATENLLGTFVFAVDEIERQCPSDGSPVEISKSLASVGSIQISARRRSAGKEYIKSKKKEIEDMLKKQIETVERFNQESPHSRGRKLTAKVRGINGIPLLYAAVDLMTSKSNIERLLKAGADPTQRSQTSSQDSLGLARSLHMRCRQKAYAAIDEGRPHAYTKALRKKCDEATFVVDLLQKYSH